VGDEGFALIGLTDPMTARYDLGVYETAAITLNTGPPAGEKKTARVAVEVRA
jgi:hypothetical protein